jgi:hypothetical protein
VGPWAVQQRQPLPVCLVAIRPQSLEKALAKATPEQLVRLRKAELDFEARMKELDVDLYALQTADTADARKHFAKDWTARFLAITLCLLFAATLSS